jgi:cytochrome c
MKFLPPTAAPALLTAAPALLAAALALLTAAPALAGDPAAGEKTFSKCKACHSVIDPTGATLVKGGKIGPDLWGVVGRTMGSFPDYEYGASMKAAGAAGGVWTEDLIATYVVDPSAFLQKQLNDPAAKGKMAFKLKDGGADVAAYLATFK